MPRLSRSQPKYCRNKSTGYAYVTIDYRQISLGKFGTPESKAKYRQVLTEYNANGGHLPSRGNASDAVTVAELIDRFGRHADDYYRTADGSPSTELPNYKATLGVLHDLYAFTPVRELTAHSFRAVQSAMIKQGWTRKSINRQMGRLRHVLKWGVSMNLVSQAVKASADSVAALRPNRSAAKESPKKAPAPQHLIDALLARAPRQIAAIVRLQLLTCMRPGEVLQMRPADISPAGPEHPNVWVYRPRKHKTQHHEKERVIPLGPESHKIIAPFLDSREADQPLFSPREAELERRAAATARRVTPAGQGNVIGSNRVRTRQREPGDSYTVNSYRRAVDRLLDRCFPFVPDVQSDVSVSEQLKQWRQAHRFHPNQLRHSAATSIRRDFGVEAARLALGHASTNLVDVYAQRDIKALYGIAANVG